MPRRFANGLVIDPSNWRADLLKLILRVSLILGLLVYLPSVVMAIQSGFVAVAVIDTIALAMIIGLYRFDRIPFRWRASVFCLNCYALGVGLLVEVGSISQIYLFGFSILTAMLLGGRAGLLSALLSSATLLFVGYLGRVAPEMAITGWKDDFPGWIVITLNFTLVNTLLTLSIGAVLSAVNKALEREIAARDSLDRERKLLRTLIDALPDAVFTKDTSGRFLICNPAMLALMGVEWEEQLAGRTMHDLFRGEIPDQCHEADLLVLAGQSLLDQEEWGVDRHGKSICHLSIKVPLRAATGDIVGLVGISRDITDRKKSEAERNRLLTQLQLQIERMPLGYLLSDSEFRYTLWNPAAERMFGFSQAEVLGRHPFEVIVPPQSQPLVATIFERIRSGNMDSHGECENRTRNGGTITCEWHNTPMFDADGTFVGLLSLAQDITARKKLAEQLRQSQKMEAVGQLAGGVAHDFNNLLTIISGYSELLLGMPEVKNNVRDSILAISHAGDRAASLTRQLLAFSRRTILQPRILDLNAVVAETGQMLRRLIGEDILFTTNLESGLDRVRVDPGEFDQILINLAVNARDAMPRGGRLSIETRNVELNDEHARNHPDCTAGNYVMLAMSDTGCGMTPEVIARIFEPFFTTKDVGAGTGLGLSMVFGIMQQSGGHIEVSSEPERGTTFRLYFPAVIDPLTRKAERVVQIGPTGTETILLVEDEAGVRTMARMSLQRQGYHVLTATDGHDALRVVQSHTGPIHLLLTDVVMPNMSGPELSEALRTSFPEIRVLFMSGYTDAAVGRHGLLQTDVAFIQKPYSPAGLAKKVREMIDAKITEIG